jgi:hypothetical protein
MYSPSDKVSHTVKRIPYIPIPNTSLLSYNKRMTKNNSSKTTTRNRKRAQPARRRRRGQLTTVHNGTTTVRGSGNYFTDLAGSFSEKLGRLEHAFERAQIRATAERPTPFADAGEVIGKKIKFGRLGRAAGSLAGSFFGSGDYTIKTNSLFSSVAPNGNISFAQSGRGTRFTQSEYIADVVASATPGAFSVTAYRLNPASATTFPWFYKIGSLFDKYEINGIIFEFRSTSGEFNGTTQALGTVITAVDYDPTDAAPTTAVGMQQMAYASSARTSEKQLHGVECARGDRASTVLYTAVDASPPTGAELRQADWGKFYIATVGVSAASVNVGQLWVHYDITLREKQL